MTYANKVVSDSDGFEVNVAAAFAVVRVSVTRVGWPLPLPLRWKLLGLCVGVDSKLALICYQYKLGL